MRWPSSSASKEVSGRSREDAEITLHDGSVCTRRTDTSTRERTPTRWGSLVHLYIQTIPRFSLLIIVHHMHKMSAYGWITVLDALPPHDSSVSALPWLSFPPNEAAPARDSWMSYIASLIPAYAKLRFSLFLLSLFLSISLWRRFALPGRHFLHPLPATASKQLSSDSTFAAPHAECL